MMTEFLKKVWDKIGAYIWFALFIIVPVIYVITGVISSISEVKSKNQDYSDVSYNGDGFNYEDYMEYGDSMYEQGKEYGYEKGKEEGYEEGIESGYETGYEDGTASCDAARHFEQEAEGYAREKSGWHPEEAWYVIEAYQNNDAWYQDGSAPTAQDYAEAIDSLIYFYEYFYCGNYE